MTLISSPPPSLVIIPLNNLDGSNVLFFIDRHLAVGDTACPPFVATKPPFSVATLHPIFMLIFYQCLPRGVFVNATAWGQACLNIPLCYIH